MTTPDAALAVPGGPEAGFDLSRLRGFSDGVFAIAITITVLQLVIPERELTQSSIAQELLDQWPVYISLVIGFVVVGFYWLNHHRLFELLDRADNSIVWLNHLLLLFVVFMPYPTELLGQYEQFPAAYVFFYATAFAIGLVNAAMWFRATRHKRLVPDSLSDQALRIYRVRSAIHPAVFALAAAATLVSPRASIVCLALLPAGPALARLLVGPMPADEEQREAEAATEEDLVTFDREQARSSSSLVRLIGGRSVGGLDRLIAFTDGVYAIAITLLGLQFVPPGQAIDTNRDLVRYILASGHDAQLDLYVGYLVGFLVIGLFWTVHHRYFVAILGQDATLRVLNLGHLFFIALLPDATELLSTHSTDASALAYYSVVAGLTGLTLTTIWMWASWRHRLIDALTPDDAIRRTMVLSLVTPTAFFASIPVAFLVGQWCQLLWWSGFIGLRVYGRQVRTARSQ